MGKSAQELYEIGYQDGQCHQRNATGQTTPKERDRKTQGGAYNRGFKQGREDRRAWLTSKGRKK